MRRPGLVPVVVATVAVAPVVFTVVVTVVVGGAAPAGAHGVGGRADLPLPVWLFAYSAAFALLISFVALRLLWPRPRLADAGRGRAVPEWADVAATGALAMLRVLALVLFAVTVVAAFLGVDSVALNIAPTALYLAFWVGMQVVSAVAGDLWRRVNPLWTVSAALDRIREVEPDRCEATGWWASHWPAAVGLGVFLWLELAYHEPASLDAVALFLAAYTAAVLAGAHRFGAGWVRTGDGFAVLFSLLAALAPVFRDRGGRLRVRVPGSGLATVGTRRGTMAVVLVVLGGTTFDGVTRTRVWDELADGRRGWDLTFVNTVGLAATILTVATVFLFATRLVGMLARDEERDLESQARRWVPSLIPIVLAYTIAHYFSLLVFEGQNFVALLSDPLGEGWNLFGTADDTIDYTAVTPNQIAYVQVAAIVLGHVGGVMAAHDRAVERYDHRTAVRSQYPLLGVMVVYTVSGLLLLLNA